MLYHQYLMNVQHRKNNHLLALQKKCTLHFISVAVYLYHYRNQKSSPLTAIGNQYLHLACPSLFIHEIPTSLA